MVKESSSSGDIRPPAAGRQVAFHQLLVGARKTWLLEALQGALADLNAGTIRSELTDLVPGDVSSLLAASGVRDEYVFPTPSILTGKPALLGYYRMLLGASQKAFYKTELGLGRFKSMERSGTLTRSQARLLPLLCQALSDELAELVRQSIPTLSLRDLNDLPLLTLGSQFQGAKNVEIGQQSTLDVFLAIAELAEPFSTDRTARRLILTNASQREVVISLAADPDVSIREKFGDELHAKVAIEIKGGTDISNVHNRAGEAEKSHQKAKSDGFRDFWTIIMKRRVDVTKLAAESPTTTSWFDIAEVLAREGPDWSDFQRRIAGELGIPLDQK